jgi:hypothetical protein
VEASTVQNANNLLGVVVKSQDALFEVTTGAGQIQVTTSGVAMALVSTLNGPVKVGDHIAPTALSGIGGKAVSNSRVIGVAQGSVDKDSSGAVKTTIKDQAGGSHEVYLLRVPVLVNVTFFSTGTDQKTLVPQLVQRLANAIAAKQVSQLPIIISLIILVVSFFASGIITFTATRSAIISIGRNPLSKGSVVAGLVQVMVLVVVILMVGLGSIFMVLRLV